MWERKRERENLRLFDSRYQQFTYVVNKRARERKWEMRESHWFAVLWYILCMCRKLGWQTSCLRSFTKFHVHSEIAWKLACMAWEHMLLYVLFTFYGDYSYAYMYWPSTLIVLSLLVQLFNYSQLQVMYAINACNACDRVWTLYLCQFPFMCVRTLSIGVHTYNYAVLMYCTLVYGLDCGVK